MSLNPYLFARFSRQTGTPRTSSAFSLVELLVVVAIVSILLGLAIPAMNSMRSATGITRAGGLLSDQIALARQEAVNKGRDVEIRILPLVEDGFTNYSGIQLWIAETDGTMSALGRVVRFPTGIGIVDSSTLSPLLDRTSGSMPYGGNNVTYKGFRFRSNGLPSGLSMSNNYLTVQQIRDNSTDLADNYFAVRVNPLTGSVTTYRP